MLRTSWQMFDVFRGMLLNGDPGGFAFFLGGLLGILENILYACLSRCIWKLHTAILIWKLLRLFNKIEMFIWWQKLSKQVWWNRNVYLVIKIIKTSLMMKS